MYSDDEVLTYDNTNPETFFDDLTKDERWLGFGYLGERRHQNHQPQTEADLLALETAIGRGLTYGQMFTWANSKYGRWYGDCMFGCNGQHANEYLPTKHLPA